MSPSAAAMKPTVLVHVGPSPTARGGIARTIGLYASSALAGEYDFRVIPSTSDGGVVSRMLVFVGSVVRLAGVLISHRDVVVHLHVASRGSYARKRLLSLLTRAFGGRYIAHIHGGGFHAFATGGGVGRGRSVRRFLEGAATVLVLSQTWSERVASLSDVRVATVIPNAVLLPAGEDVPIRLTRSRDVPRVLFVGHIVEHKGVEDLAAALILLGEQGVRVQAVLVGAGDTREFTREVSAATGVTVDLPGWLDDAAVAQEYADADTFVLPSRVEGVPLALLEAMSWALPCVVTPVGGVPDVVTEGVTAVVVPPQDPEALAAAIGRVLGDSALRDRLGAAARDYVGRTHALEVVCDALRGVYDRLGVVPRHDSGVVS